MVCNIRLRACVLAPNALDTGGSPDRRAVGRHRHNVCSASPWAPRPASGPSGLFMGCPPAPHNGMIDPLAQLELRGISGLVTQPSGVTPMTNQNHRVASAYHVE